LASVLLKDVTKVFKDGTVAVRDVNLEINDKEFVVLVGPSGCGKSTLLRMIAGLEEITSGDISIEGQIINHIPPKDRNVAMVFQNYALYPHMTVFDNMSFGLKHRKIPKGEIERRIDKAAGILGIKEHLDRKPNKLSGGQRQRVAVGRAMVRQPDVFLFDEPLSNLDAKLRLQLRVEINRLHKRLQTTMIYVTHDQIEAMTMGSKIVVLKDGVVQQVDAPMNLYDHPENKFVAGFIGSPAMNFITGRIQSNRTLQFSSPLFNFELPENLGESLKSYEGKEVVLGIRPEHICQASSPAKKAVTQLQNIHIEVVEPVGNEVFLYFSNENQHYCIRAASDRSYRPGENIQVSLDANRIYFFDPKTEDRIV